MFVFGHETNNSGFVLSHLVSVAFRGDLQSSSRYQYVGLLFPTIGSVFHIFLVPDYGGERSRSDHINEERKPGNNNFDFNEHALCFGSRRRQ